VLIHSPVGRGGKGIWSPDPAAPPGIGAQPLAPCPPIG